MSFASHNWFINLGHQWFIITTGPFEPKKNMYPQIFELLHNVKLKDLRGRIPSLICI